MALQRAGDIPLDLYIGDISDSPILETVVSHKCSIRSLSIEYCNAPGDVVSQLDRMDLRALKRLCATEIPYPELEILMDLALKSTQARVDIEISSSDHVDADFLKHDLFQRASYFYIGSCK
jgi:hypothetical protein